VDRIAFREGQTVHQGDLLYVIDPRPYKEAVDSAKANLERERAAADFAKIQSDRAQTLRESDAISQKNFRIVDRISRRIMLVWRLQRPR
jgi:multidrug efflux system membrane fusion protein